MAYLVDTNIILRMAQPDHPMCASALNALGILRHQQEECYLTHQNLVEFWRSATRPVEKNGLGLAILEASAEQSAFGNAFSRTTGCA